MNLNPTMISRRVIFNILLNDSLMVTGCGKTKRMDHNFTVSENSKAKMVCSDKRPCYCYGNICLVSKSNNCFEGNVFLDGSPICGAGQGWHKNLTKIICKELGFRDARRITKNREYVFIIRISL